MFDDIEIASKSTLLDIEYYQGRYEFAKKLYTKSKHKESVLLLLAIDKVLDFIDIKKRGLADLHKHKSYITELEKMMKYETSRNGMFTIGLAAKDINKIYDLEI